MLAGAPGEEEEIIIPQMQAVKTQPSTFTKISVYCLTLNGSKYHEGKVSPVRTVHRRFSAGLQATLSKKGSSHLSFLMLLLGQLKVLTSIWCFIMSFAIFLASKWFSLICLYIFFHSEYDDSLLANDKDIRDYSEGHTLLPVSNPIAEPGPSGTDTDVAPPSSSLQQTDVH